MTVLDLETFLTWILTYYDCWYLITFNSFLKRNVELFRNKSHSVWAILWFQVHVFRNFCPMHSQSLQLSTTNGVKKSFVLSHGDDLSIFVYIKQFQRQEITVFNFIFIYCLWPNPIHFPELVQPQWSPEVRVQMFILIRPLWLSSHCWMQCPSHWHSCICTAQFDRTGCVLYTAFCKVTLVKSLSFPATRNLPVWEPLQFLNCFFKGRPLACFWHIFILLFHCRSSSWISQGRHSSLTCS